MKVETDYNFPKEIFDCPLNDTLLWEVMRGYLHNLRRGKASTKTRSEVHGGSRKPWRQKGTGRSRQGTIRSPIWRGGGVVFGPKPRNFYLKIPKRKRRQVLFHTLSHMYRSERIKVIDQLAIPEPKTRLIFDLLKSLELEGKRVLIIVDKKDRNVILAARNIPNLNIEIVKNLNGLTVLGHEYLVFTRDAIDAGCKMWLEAKSED